MIILSENYKLSQVQMQMINFPESQIQPGSISTFHNFQSNSRSKESEVNHQTCNPPDFIFETSNNKKKHDVVSFKSSNFQKKFLRSNFLIRPWFFSHQKVLNVKSFKICRFYCQRLTRANFLSPPIYESVEKNKQKLEMIWRNWTLGSCSFLLLSENTSTKSQWRD